MVKLDDVLCSSVGRFGKQVALLGDGTVLESENIVVITMPIALPKHASAAQGFANSPVAGP